MKVLILAPPKSGSSALYEVIRRVMPAETVCFFEPPSILSEELAAAPHALTKKLTLATEFLDVHYAERMLVQYDKVILLARHPLDVLVSTTLWAVNDSLIWEDVDLFLRYQARLDRFRGETGPRRFLDLCRDLGEIFAACWRRKPPQAINYMREEGKFLEQYIRNLEIWHTVHLHYRNYKFHHVCYEDMIEGNLKGLSDYLGLELQPPSEIAGTRHAAVRRTGGSGNWRDWLGEEDIAFMNQRIPHLLQPFGYSASLEDGFVAGVISEADTTRYVERLLAARQVLDGLDFSAVSYGALTFPAITESGAYAVPGLHWRVPVFHPSCGGAEIVEIALRTPEGVEATAFSFGQEVEVGVRVRFTSAVEWAIFTLSVRSAQGEELFALRTAHTMGPQPFAAGEVVEVVFNLKAALSANPYLLVADVLHSNENGWPRLLHRRSAPSPLIVRKLLATQNLRMSLRRL